jgi:DnaJ-class molecular chaperone
MATSPKLKATLLAEGRALLSPKLTHYQVLDISPREAEEDPAALNYARSLVARIFHPDKFSDAAPDERQLAHDVMSRANGAYAVLSDPRERKIYRLTITKTHYACGSCSGQGQRRATAGFKNVVWRECSSCKGDGYLHKETK